MNFLPNILEQPDFKLRTGFDDFDVFRSFDDGTGKWTLGISGKSPLKAKQDEVSVNVVERGDEMLATLVATGKRAITAEVPVGQGSRLAFEPLAGRAIAVVNGTLALDLAPETYRHVLIVPPPAGRSSSGRSARGGRRTRNTILRHASCQFPLTRPKEPPFSSQSSRAPRQHPWSPRTARSSHSTTMRSHRSFW